MIILLWEKKVFCRYFFYFNIFWFLLFIITLKVLLNLNKIVINSKWKWKSMFGKKFKSNHKKSTFFKNLSIGVLETNFSGKYKTVNLWYIFVLVYWESCRICRFGRCRGSVFCVLSLFQDFDLKYLFLFYFSLVVVGFL
jgi:hypothetical protein